MWVKMSEGPSWRIATRISPTSRSYRHFYVSGRKKNSTCSPLLKDVVYRPRKPFYTGPHSHRPSHRLIWSNHHFSVSLIFIRLGNRSCFTSIICLSSFILHTPVNKTSLSIFSTHKGVNKVITSPPAISLFFTLQPNTSLMNQWIMMMMKHCLISFYDLKYKTTTYNRLE